MDTGAFPQHSQDRNRAMNTLRIFEFDSLMTGQDDHSITETQLDYLCRLQESRNVQLFEETRQNRRWCLRFAGMVGAVALPGGATLEILPKIDRDDNAASAQRNLMLMLAETGLFPKIEDELGHYAASPHLIEAYLNMAARMAWALIHQGLPKTYQTEELSAVFLKGQWLLNQQFARYPNRLDRHAIRVSRFTEDSYQNRVLRAGMRAMARVTRQSKTQQLLQSIEFLLNTVGDLPVSQINFTRLRFDRRISAWQPLFELIRQFIESCPADLAQGTSALGPAWLFRMDELFERYIANRLRRVSGIEVHVQGPPRHFLKSLQNESRFLFKPDIIVGPKEKPLLIIDTKWKRLDNRFEKSISIQDLRQVFAYAKIYGVPRVALVYPASAEICRSTSFTSNEISGRIQIDIHEVSIGYQRTIELDKQLLALLEL
jgi:5-methylcytosine-specific restriction enzyme subunit McrC